MKKETKGLIGAIIAGSFAYLIPLYFGNIWLGYFLLLSITIGYLLILFRSAQRKLDEPPAKWAFMGIVGLLVLFHAIAFFQHYARGNEQIERLLDARKSNVIEITKADVQKALTRVFAVYHRNEGSSILETAKEQIPQKLSDNGRYIADLEWNKQDSNEDDALNYFYEMNEEADELSVIVVSDIALGEHAMFENYDGQTGQFEIAFHLNKEGVRHEIRN